MPLETVEFNGKPWLKLQSEGNASQFALPFAKKICKGVGYDIGYGKPEWKLPGSIGIDLADNDEYHAMNLPYDKVDYIYSSHCLEHLDDWVEALEYWWSMLKPGGVLFLYLPHFAQEYWRPWNNRKHKHVMDGKQITDCIASFEGSKFMFLTHGFDLNASFYVVAEKVE